MPVQSGTVCSRCGDTVDEAQVGMSPYDAPLCRACRLAPPPYIRAVAFGPYQGRMKQAIHALKYGRMHPAAQGLGKMLAVAIAQLQDDAPAEILVVPVPLHKSKYGLRGFNQARSLATYALQSLSKSHPAWRLTMASSTLMRLRATESQAGLSPHMRRLNVRGAFSVSKTSEVAKKHVLLVDDILTTGATARAASKALMDAGAASVWVATLARARRVNQFGRRISFEDANDVEQQTDELPVEQQGEIFEKASKFSSHDHPSF
jgi:ComF family protein